MNKANNHADIIAWWGYKLLAERIQEYDQTITKRQIAVWSVRNRIPLENWRHMVLIAQRDRLPLTIKKLYELRYENQ